MKIALKLKLPNAKTIVFTVHELLELAQSVMKSEYDNCGPDSFIKPPYYGEHFYPQKLATTKDWLAASKCLQQGTPKKLQEKIKSNLSEYQDMQWLKLIEYYEEKMDINFLNTQENDSTRPIWEYRNMEIETTVDTIDKSFEVEKNLENYRFVDLGVQKVKPTNILPEEKAAKKPKPKPRPRGFYVYTLEDTKEVYCLMVHSKNKSNEVLLDDSEENFYRLLILLSDDNNELEENKKLAIERKVKKYFEQEKKIKFSLTYADLKYHLSCLNDYLLELKWSLAVPEKDAFLELFLKVYDERCKKDADSDCLTHLRCIIDDLLTVPVLIGQYHDYIFPEFSLESKDLDEESKLSIYYHALNQILKSEGEEVFKPQDKEEVSVLFGELIKQNKYEKINIEDAKNLLRTYCQKHNVGLYSPDGDRFEKHMKQVFFLCGIEEICLKAGRSNRQISYFLAYLRDAHHKGWSKILVESEIAASLSTLGEKSQKYEANRIRHSAYFLLRKRIDLYEQFNGIKFLKKFSQKYSKLEFLKNGDGPEDVVERFSKYNFMLNKIILDYAEGVSQFYTLLRLFCRSGETITDDVKRKLLDYIEKNKDKKMSCEDMCLTSDEVKWDLKQNPLSYSAPSIEFFVVGDRVIGINHNDPNKPLYVYDYGSTQDTFAEKFQMVKELRKKTIDELKKLKENVEDHTKYIEILIEWYKKLSTNPEIVKVFKQPLLFNGKELNFSNIEQIKSIIEQNARTFGDEQLRINHIEKMFENYVIRDLMLELEIEVQHSVQVSSLPKNKSIVTYPQICRELLTSEQAENLAKYMRSLLKGEVAKIDNLYHPMVVLTVAWFLAETGRNPLTSMITMMMLDLIEEQIPYNSNPDVKKYYNWRDVIWNYNIVNNSLTSDEREQTYSQQEGWAGKHPMCHSGSFARLFSKDRFPPIEDSLDQVRQKEGSILINWLAHVIKQSHKEIEIEIVTLHGKSKQSQTWSKKFTFFTYDVKRSEVIQCEDKVKVVEEVIKPLLCSRLENFDLQFISRPPTHSLK
jgi:hypothetical protein